MNDRPDSVLKRRLSQEAKGGSAGALPPRQVRFPAERSMGTLWIRNSESTAENYAFWESWGEARGGIAVPAGQDLRLVVSPQSATDLSPLSTFRPDDLQYLQLSGTRVSNAGLAYLRHLTGLKVLWLYDTPISDAGLVHLRGLTGLRVLNLRSTLTSTAAVDALQDALPQCEFRRVWK